MCKWAYWKPAGPQRDAFHENAAVREHQSSHRSQLLPTGLQSDTQYAAVVSPAGHKHVKSHIKPRRHTLTHRIMQTQTFPCWLLWIICLGGKDTQEEFENLAWQRLFVETGRQVSSVWSGWRDTAAEIFLQHLSRQWNESTRAEILEACFSAQRIVQCRGSSEALHRKYIQMCIHFKITHYIINRNTLIRRFRTKTLVCCPSVHPRSNCKDFFWYHGSRCLGHNVSNIGATG